MAKHKNDQVETANVETNQPETTVVETQSVGNTALAVEDKPVTIANPSGHSFGKPTIYQHVRNVLNQKLKKAD
jgi:hypothetical protein